MPIELDIENANDLTRYLRDTQRVAAGESPSICVLHGGVSNRTVLVERASGEAWVLKQALAKLRVKVDWFSDVRRIHREALGLKVLEHIAPRGTTTPLVFEDQDHHLLAMRAVPQPHSNWKHALLAGDLQTRHVVQFGELLAAIHRGSDERRDELATLFDDRTFFETLRVEPYYQYAATQAPESATFIARLVDDTRVRRLCVVHGDYSPKNILVHDDRLILLDHEVIHWGDPAFDLGFSLTHLLSKAHHLPSYRASFAAAALLHWQTYLTSLGDVSWAKELEPMVVRHTLGCLLARVAGRSPLEYLGEDERLRQRRVVIHLMQAPPVEVAGLVDAFVKGL